MREGKRDLFNRNFPLYRPLKNVVAAVVAGRPINDVVMAIKPHTRKLGIGALILIALAGFIGLFGNLKRTSAASISIAGTVFQTNETTAFDCSATNLTISAKVNGAGSYTTVCNAANGTYLISAVTVVNGDSITVYIDGATQKAAHFTKGTGSNQTSIDLYQDHAVTSNNLANSNIDMWDKDNDTDIHAGVTTSNLTVDNDWGLVVKTGAFAPGGAVTTLPSGPSSYSGSFEIKTGASFNILANALSIGGSFTNSGSLTTPASGQTTSFTATTTGKTITSNGGLWHNLTFNGVGGDWTLQDALSTAPAGANSLVMTNGSLLGTQNVTIAGTAGSNANGTNGIINLTGGTFEKRQNGTGTFGSSSAVAWTFNNLTFSNSSLGNITSDASGTGTINVTGVLSIGKSGDTNTTTLNAGARNWVLSGTGGTPFTLLSSPAAALTASTSTFSYTGNNGSGTTAITAVTYNNLTLNNAAETYVLSGAITASGDLAITGGTLDVDTTNNYSLTIGGSYSNTGTFTARAGTVTFSATTTGKALSGTLDGSSSFYNLTFSGSGGGWTNVSSLVVTNDWIINNGTVSGTNNITVNGNVGGTGGTTNFTGGVFKQRVAANKSFGSTSGSGARTYYDLTFSNSSGATRTITTQTGGTGGITVSDKLAVGESGDTNTTVFDAGNRAWSLTGTTGTPFTLLSSPAASLTASTSTFTYSGDNSSGNTTIATATYNNLTTNNASETYVMGSSFTVGGTATITAGIFSVTGATLTLTSTSTSLTVGGTLSGTGNVIANGKVNGTGTVNLTGGTFEQRVGASTNFGATSGGFAWTFYDLIFSNSSGSSVIIANPANANSSFNISDVVRIGKSGDTAGTTLTSNTHNWVLSGTTGTPLIVLSSPAGSLTATSNNRFTYSGNNSSGNTTIAPVTYYNLTLNNSAETYVLGGPTTVASNLELTAGTLSGTDNITVNGDVLSTSGTINLTGGTFEQRTVGPFSNFINQPTTSLFTFYNLVFSNASSSNTTFSTGGGNSGYQLEVTNTLNIGKSGDTAATILSFLNIHTWTLSGTTGTPLTLLASPAASITNGGGTPIFAYTGNNSSGNTVVAATNYPGNLIINNPAEIYVLGGATTVSNLLTITAGTLDVDTTNNYDLTIGGSYTNSGTFTARAGTVTLTATTSAQTLTGTMTGSSAFYNLVFNGVGGGWTFSNSAAVSNNLTITNGTVTAPVSTLTVGNNYTNTGTFTHNSGTVTFNGTSAGKTINTGGSPFYNLILNGVGGGWTLQSTLTTVNNLIITAGTLDVDTTNNYAVTIGGSYTNSGTFTARAGTVTLSATTPGQTLISGSSAFYNLTLNGSGGIWTLYDALDVNNNLTITAGTLDTNSIGSYLITLGGSYSNNGAFLAEGGTVRLDGLSKQNLSGAMIGSNAFYNLDITNNSGSNPSDCERTGFVPSVDFDTDLTTTGAFTLTTAATRVEYNSSSIYTFATVDWNGQAASTSLYFRNSDLSGSWKLNVVASGSDQRRISFLDVGRSDASSGSLVIASDGTTVNCGNNTNWDFSAPNIPVDLTQTVSNGPLLAPGDWTTKTDFVFSGSLSDSDNPSALRFCVELKPIGTNFSNTEDRCADAIGYTDTPVTASLTFTNVPTNVAYHWQSRVKDAGNTYSNWTSYASNSETDRDFGIDTIAPTVPGLPATNDSSALPTWTWKGSSDLLSGLGSPAYTVEWSLDPNFQNDASLSSSSVAHFTQPQPLSNGTWYFQTKATDEVGNDSAFSSVGSVTIAIKDNPVPPPVTNNPVATPSITSNPTTTPSDLLPTIGLNGCALTPLVFNYCWQLLPSSAISQFVLQPLPRDYLALLKTFPSLDKTFQKVGITRLADLKKLYGIQLALPSLQDPGTVPNNVLYALGPAQKLTLQLNLSINNSGQPVQTINTTVGQSLTLAVRPDKKVREVTGYLTFRSRSTSLKPSIDPNSLSSLLASPALAQESTGTTDLVLQKFVFTDSNNDGLYTTSLTAPSIDGTYEVTTLLDYADMSAPKNLHLITVVDPEGYVYEKVGKLEARIPNATITLEWLNPQTNNYETWDATSFQQENPQVTTATGRYAFLVPEGTYRLSVKAKNYKSYQGEPFQIQADYGVHTNIQLIRTLSLQSLLSWQALIIGLFIVFLVIRYRHQQKKKEKHAIN